MAALHGASHADQRRRRENLHWFGTMSVAPNGRIDAVWLDTRDAPRDFHVCLYYSYSHRPGRDLVRKLSSLPAFDPHGGLASQEKMGDYYRWNSDDDDAYLAWANTFNGEQDVWFSQIIPDIRIGIAGKIRAMTTTRWTYSRICKRKRYRKGETQRRTGCTACIAGYLRPDSKGTRARPCRPVITR